MKQQYNSLWLLFISPNLLQEHLGEHHDGGSSTVGGGRTAEKTIDED